MEWFHLFCLQFANVEYKVPIVTAKSDATFCLYGTNHMRFCYTQYSRCVRWRLEKERTRQNEAERGPTQSYNAQLIVRAVHDVSAQKEGLSTKQNKTKQQNYIQYWHKNVLQMFMERSLSHACSQLKTRCQALDIQLDVGWTKTE